MFTATGRATVTAGRWTTNIPSACPQALNRTMSAAARATVTTLVISWLAVRNRHRLLFDVDRQYSNIRVRIDAVDDVRGREESP
jgi:hypothetical protein